MKPLITIDIDKLFIGYYFSRDELIKNANKNGLNINLAYAYVQDKVYVYIDKFHSWLRLSIAIHFLLN